MKKPLSPAEWDAATDFQRRKGIVPKVRPTEELYAADLAKWEATQAASAAKTEIVRKLEAVGGRYWNSPACDKPRVYFEMIGADMLSGYVDLNTGARVSKVAAEQSAFEAELARRLGE